ncbi:MAG: PilZ domain-containing protein [Pseudomonadota bacterium]
MVTKAGINFLKGLRAKPSTDRTDEAEKLAELQRKAKARADRLAADVKKPETQSDLHDFNTREGKRVETEHPATVLTEGDGEITATIADISSTGFRLQLPRGAYLPETVIVECEMFQGMIVANVVWQDGKFAGLNIDRDITRRLASSTGQSDPMTQLSDIKKEAS